MALNKKLFLFGFVTALIAQVSAAQMILPPEDIGTQAGRERFAQELIRQMPSLTSNQVTNYDVQTLAQQNGMVHLMHALMTSLRQDENYMRLAAARPQPMTFKFYTFKTEERTQTAVTPAFMKDLAALFKSEYASLFNNSESEFSVRIENRAAELGAIGVQSMGIITGLGTIFPPDERREILGQKTLEARVEALKKAFKGVKVEELKEKFASERFGLDRGELTKKSAMDLLDSALAREKELVQLVSLLELYSNDRLDEKDWAPADIQWILSDEKAAPEFLQARKLDAKLGAAYGALKSQARSAYTSEQAGVKMEVPDKTLIVKEVSPAVAVFRSCTSNDCSTGTSWAYPFSPMERDYYIYEESNPSLEIGYVSGNMLEVDGKPTFYLRDMTGMKLSPAQIEMIIPGFAAALPLLGVTQMAVAHENFHLRENHYAEQANRISQIIQPMPQVRTNFTDAWIRTTYLDPVVSSSGYDSPVRHADARLYDESQAGKTLKPVRVTLLAGAAMPIEPGRKLSQKELLERVRHAYVANNPLFLNGASEDYSDWKRLFAVLSNERGVALKDYYASAEAELKKAGIKLSNSIQREFPDLFYSGHLSAPNAFSVRDEGLLNRTYELIVDKYAITQDVGVLENLENERQTAVLKSAIFQKSAANFLTRQRPADRIRVAQLWALGYRFDFEMNLEQFTFLAANASPADPYEAMDLLERFLKNETVSDQDIPENLFNQVIGLLDNYKAEDEAPSIRAAQLLSRMEISVETWLSEIKHSVKDEDNDAIRFPLAIALLRSGFELDSDSTAIGFVYLNENLKNREIPKALRDQAQEVLAGISEANKAGFQERYQAYVERKERKRREKEACEDGVTNGGRRRAG